MKVSIDETHETFEQENVPEATFKQQQPKMDRSLSIEERIAKSLKSPKKEADNKEQSKFLNHNKKEKVDLKNMKSAQNNS